MYNTNMCIMSEIALQSLKPAVSLDAKKRLACGFRFWFMLNVGHEPFKICYTSSSVVTSAFDPTVRCGAYHSSIIATRQF
jgi:hypothetical protein